IIAMPLSWFLLTKVCFRKTLPEVKGGAEWVRNELDKLGPMSNGEKAVAVVFLIAVVLWCTSSLLRSLTIGGVKPLAALSDNLIAMLCGVSLFCIPVDGKGGRCIDWSDCKTIPWDVLILFGGGLSMAAALQNTGAGEVIGAQATMLVGSPKLLIIAGVATLVAMTSNFTSNTALAATMLPLLAGVGAVLGVSNEIVLMTTAIAASFAFMMPVGTPPNAIVFSTGRLTIMHMVRAGAVISAACLMVLVGVVEIML
ncbi:MAG: anion permease, partial [Duodenibacillus sp.]|nr:anion permease [Duodenibacillus sp.]